MFFLTTEKKIKSCEGLTDITRLTIGPKTTHRTCENNPYFLLILG